MRSSFLAVGALLCLLAATARGQVSWNFTDVTGAAATSPANITAGTLTASNGGTLTVASTSPSSGYSGASGGNNAAVTARTGTFSAANSTCLEFTLTAGSGVALKVTNLSFGSRSTSTGPAAIALYSSADNFAAPLGTAAVATNSTWALVSFPSLNAFSAAAGAVTFRIFGYDGTGTAAAGNWRIDDLTVTAVTYVPPTITAQPAALAVASGQVAGFTVAASGNGALSFQWRKGGIAITGNPTATTANLTLGAVTTAAAGSYDVVVSDSAGSVISNPANLTVNKALAGVTIAAQSASYDGAPHAATATTNPSGLGVVYSYTATSGAIYSASPLPPVNAGTYSVTATVSDPEYQGSGTGTLTITKAPATIVFNSLSATFDGLPHAATATSTPTGISILYTYDGSAALPTDAGSYTVVAAANHQNYTGSATGTFVITPAAATIELGSLNRTFTGAGQAATAATTPAGQAVVFTYTGTDGTIFGPSTTPPTNAGSYSVTATIAGGNYTGTASATLLIAPAAQTITFPAPGDRLATAGSFTLNATSSSGLPVLFTLTAGTPEIATLSGNTVAVSGSAGVVTVRATQPGNANYLAATPVERSFAVVTNATPPHFAVQPVNTVGYAGDSVTLSASVMGTPAPALQWRKDGNDIPGATDATFAVPIAAVSDSGIYHLVATNVAGSVTSFPVALTITKRPQTISFPVVATGYPPGTAVTLPVSASSGLPVTLTLVSGGASLSGTTITGTRGSVTLRATQAGNDYYAAAEPVERTISFVSGGLSPFITLSPADQTVLAGASVTFRSTAIGTPAPLYQWEKDGTPIAGATSATLALANVTVADAGRYTVNAMNSAGTARSSATLNVHAAPAIVTHPQPQSVFAGEPVMLAVVATGAPSPTFQWRRNGTPLPGATTATLSIASAVPAQGGQYDVVVTNRLGAVTSAAALLTVTQRNFAGSYFGRFGGVPSTGDFVLHVRSDGSAVFLGHLRGSETGIVTLDLPIGADGKFSLALNTVNAAPDDVSGATDPSLPARAAAPRPITLRGALDGETGAVTGQIAELGTTFDGVRAATGPFTPQAGLYQSAVVGSASGRGYAVLSADGQAFLITAAGTTLDSVRGSVDATGKLVATSTGGAAVDLRFANGSIAGSVRASSGTVATIAGAVDTLLGLEHLVNLSVRGTTTNAAPLITGFVVTGTAPKQVLLRAAGPALVGAPFNVPNALADPTVQLFRGNNVTAQNDDWGGPAAAAAAVAAATTRAGAFPFRAGSADAALVVTLQPGPYTVMVGGGNGATLAEIYEVLDTNERQGARRLGNLSARGLVAPGAPLIAGLVIGGTAPQRVLIRGIGPTLGAAPFNLAGVLPNPQLTLFRGATALRSNDDWFRDAENALVRDAAQKAGAFALGAQSLDAAMLLFLEPGAYTVQLSGPTSGNGSNASGLALLEVYESTPQ